MLSDLSWNAASVSIVRFVRQSLQTSRGSVNVGAPSLRQGWPTNGTSACGAQQTGELYTIILF
jgi:hypothetical protein